MTEHPPPAAPRPMEYLQAAVGATCSEAVLLEDRSLQLRFSGSAAYELWAPLPWRIRSQGAVALSDWDDAAQIQSLLPALVGRRLRAISLDQPAQSLTLTLDGDTAVETFTTRRDGTHWTWTTADSALTAGPNGTLHHTP